ncbi:MAG: GIY-YIG nuclease family protein [Candidatus Absconditabacteria bacterium]
MYYVYILSNKKYGTLYVGVTNNLIRRVFEHKDKFIDGFTKRYSINYLVYYEEYSEIESAIFREKEIKHWNRNWKIRLIEKNNPKWTDLYTTMLE